MPTEIGLNFVDIILNNRDWFCHSSSLPQGAQICLNGNFDVLTACAESACVAAMVDVFRWTMLAI